MDQGPIPGHHVVSHGFLQSSLKIETVVFRRSTKLSSACFSSDPVWVPWKSSCLCCSNWGTVFVVVRDRQFYPSIEGEFTGIRSETVIWFGGCDLRSNGCGLTVCSVLLSVEISVTWILSKELFQCKLRIRRRRRRPLIWSGSKNRNKGSDR